MFSLSGKIASFLLLGIFYLFSFLSLRSCCDPCCESGCTTFYQAKIAIQKPASLSCASFCQFAITVSLSDRSNNHIFIDRQTVSISTLGEGTANLARTYDICNEEHQQYLESLREPSHQRLDLGGTVLMAVRTGCDACSTLTNKGVEMVLSGNSTKHNFYFNDSCHPVISLIPNTPNPLCNRTLPC